MPSKKLFGVPLDRQSLGEMIRFSIVGVLVTAIHYAVYWLLQLVIDVNISAQALVWPTLSTTCCRWSSSMSS